MKISVVINEDAKQIMLTPENDHEKSALRLIAPGDKIEAVTKWGSFLDKPEMYGVQVKMCQGGYLRKFEDTESLMFDVYGNCPACGIHKCDNSEHRVARISCFAHTPHQPEGEWEERLEKITLLTTKTLNDVWSSWEFVASDQLKDLIRTEIAKARLSALDSALEALPSKYDEEVSEEPDKTTRTTLGVIKKVITVRNNSDIKYVTGFNKAISLSRQKIEELKIKTNKETK